MTAAPWPSRVAIVGSGYMGRGIGEVLALAGAECVLADLSGERAEAALDTLMAEATRHEADALIPGGSADALRARVRSAASVEEAVATADYVVEAVFEDRAVKEDVLRRIEARAGHDVPISTNSSAISIESLGRTLAHPHRFLGAHWFNPPQFVPAVELIPSKATAPAVLDAVDAFLSRAGKAPARVADSPGFVANRLQYALFQEAAAVVDEGIATAEAVDRIVSTSFGFRLPFFGPFAIADMAGLDVYTGAYRVLGDAFSERFTPPQTLKDLVESGQLGAKTGSGFVIGTREEAEAMASRRDRQYVALSQLLRASEERSADDTRDRSDDPRGLQGGSTDD